MAMINENKLFKLLPYFFDNPDKVILELAQNACRANATRFDISLKDGVLTVSDDGCGIDDPRSLVVLAESDWNGQVEAEQMPAGWGLFFLYSLAETVELKSTFGALRLNCSEFLSNADYREKVLDLVDGKKTYNGTHVSAVLKKGIEIDEEILGFFPLDVFLNGQPVVKRTPESLLYGAGLILRTSYRGNDVFVLLEGPHTLSNTSVIWYGVPIHGRRTYPYTTVVINVTEGMPLTPVLPYRNEIQENDKYEAFLKFVHAEVENYCVERINAVDWKKEEVEICCRALRGRPAAINRTRRWFVEWEEPYVQAGYGESCLRAGDEVVEQGRTLTQKKLVLQIGSKKVDLDDLSVQLPAGLVKQVSRPYPSWLKPKEEKVVIHIAPRRNKDLHGLTLHECKIQVDGKAMKGMAIAVSEGWAEPDIYTVRASDAWTIAGQVFTAFLYRDDGDTWDTQEWEYENTLGELVAAFDKRVSVKDLFKPFASFVSPDSVRQIKVEPKSRKILIYGEKGKKMKTLTY